jgi:hypothetical protein
MASEHICFSSTANNLNSGINFDGESDRSGHTGSSAGRELIFGSLRNEDRASAAASSAGRHVVTRVNYYRDPGDGSPPAPVVVGA